MGGDRPMGDLNVNFTLVEQDAGHLFPKVKTRLKKANTATSYTLRVKAIKSGHRQLSLLNGEEYISNSLNNQFDNQTDNSAKTVMSHPQLQMSH